MSPRWPPPLPASPCRNMWPLTRMGTFTPPTLCTSTITIYTEGSKGDAAPIADHRREQHRPEHPGRHRGGFQRQHLCGGLRRRERVCLSGAGKQHRVAQRGPHRHHQREQHRPGDPIRHRAGFQRQHLCGGLRRHSVFVYPALGSSTGLLNEAPTATISGSNTGLSFPHGIALDSSRNIYVAELGNLHRATQSPACLSIRRWEAAPGRSTSSPPPPSAGATPAWRPHTASRWIPAAKSMWQTNSRQRVCLSAAGKQHRAAQRGPDRHHQR